jgi:ribonuclease HI
LISKTPQGGTIYHSFSLLKEECSNNEEYEALLFCLLLALSMDVRNILVYGDSQFIIRQFNNIYEVRKPELAPYHMVAQILIKKFEHIQLLHVPRSKNSSADVLAKLATSLVLPEGELALVKIEERCLLPAVLELIPQEYEVHHIVANTSGDDDWCKPFIDYFNHGTLPHDIVERRRLQRRPPSYVVKARTLYRCSFGQEMLLLCVSRNKAK